MKTKYKKHSKFRKVKCSTKVHKVHDILQNATRIVNNQCQFIVRHQLYILIYREWDVYWVYFGCGEEYIGETGNLLRQRVTVHN